jgi:O-glycosyl hydrolase
LNEAWPGWHKQAVYLQSTGSYDYKDGTGVQLAAFKNPGSGATVLVIINKIKSALQVEVSLASGKVWNGYVPARSVVTWVVPTAAT